MCALAMHLHTQSHGRDAARAAKRAAQPSSRRRPARQLAARGALLLAAGLLLLASALLRLRPLLLLRRNLEGRPLAPGGLQPVGRQLAAAALTAAGGGALALRRSAGVGVLSAAGT